MVAAQGCGPILMEPMHTVADDICSSPKMLACASIVARADGVDESISWTVPGLCSTCDP